MFDASINQYLNEKQVLNVLDYNKSTGVVFFHDGTVRCPICDERHDNNTNCQRMG